MKYSIDRTTTARHNWTFKSDSSNWIQFYVNSDGMSQIKMLFWRLQIHSSSIIFQMEEHPFISWLLGGSPWIMNSILKLCTLTFEAPGSLPGPVRMYANIPQRHFVNHYMSVWMCVCLCAAGEKWYSLQKFHFI